MSDGGSYQIVTSDHLLEIQNRIRAELGLEKLSQLKTTATVYENLYGSLKTQSTQDSSYYYNSGSLPAYTDSSTQYSTYSSETSSSSSYQDTTAGTQESGAANVTPSPQADSPAEQQSSGATTGTPAAP